MPMIQVYMLQGRTDAQKRQLIEAMTNVMVEVCGSKPERVGVIVNEIDPANWGRAGVPHSDNAQPVSEVSR